MLIQLLKGKASLLKLRICHLNGVEKRKYNSKYTVSRLQLRHAVGYVRRLNRLFILEYGFLYIYNLTSALNRHYSQYHFIFLYHCKDVFRDLLTKDYLKLYGVSLIVLLGLELPFS